MLGGAVAIAIRRRGYTETARGSGITEMIARNRSSEVEEWEMAFSHLQMGVVRNPVHSPLLLLSLRTLPASNSLVWSPRTTTGVEEEEKKRTVGEANQGTIQTRGC